MILDEVQCGIGRTGKVFAYEWWNVKPDMIGLAKGLGGGFPIGAILLKKKIAKYITPGSHGSTFGGNPLVTASANAVLDIVAEKDFLKFLGHKIDYLSKELDKIMNEYPKFVAEVRGQGFLRGLKLFDPVNEIQNELKKNKVLFVAAAENVLRLLPPLTVSIEEIDIAISALRKVACKGIK